MNNANLSALIILFVMVFLHFLPGRMPRLYIVYACAGKVEEFQAPAKGDYKLEVWGAEGGCAWGTPQPENQWGRGGYSYGTYSSNGNSLLYICVGGAGSSTGYNGGTPPYYYGGAGGGCTDITSTEDLGILSNYVQKKQYILIVAGGGGGVDWAGVGGYGGGQSGGNGSRNGYGYGATQSSGGTGDHNGAVSGDGTFGKGGFTYYEGFKFQTNEKPGIDCSAGGGGGYYGGGSGAINGDAAGGGTGYVNTTILTNASTIAGNTSFPSPLGGTETGHTGNGYAIITQVSY